MAMKRCPVCGEKYSDTYKTCPFCEEEALWEEEDAEVRRTPKSSRRTAHGLQYNLITPTLIVLILMMAILLVYLLFGDKISDTIGGGKDDTPDNPGVNSPVEPTPPVIPAPDTSTDPEPGTDPDPGAGGADSGTASGVMP